MAHYNDTSSDINLFIALKNPFLYRSYYYDIESNLYYLNSRYYDPETGRFINIDDVDILDKTEDIINGLNLYTYCLNNPVNCHDPVGYFALTSLIVGLIIGAIIGATVGGAFAYKTAKSSGATGWELAGWTLLGVFGGAVIGGAIGAGLGYLAGVAFPAINAFLSSTFTIGFGGGLSLATGGTIGGGITISVGSAVTVGGSITGSLGSLILLARTGRSNGYWGEKWPGDHEPDHFHLKGEDGSNVRIGRDGRPLEGEPLLNSQQKKALKKLWEQILRRLFKL